MIDAGTLLAASILGPWLVPVLAAVGFGLVIWAVGWWR